MKTKLSENISNLNQESDGAENKQYQDIKDIHIECVDIIDATENEI